MNDQDFLDVIYAAWAKTTGAENTYWQPEENPDVAGMWNIVSVDEKQNKKLVSFSSREVDSDFICGLHACVGDLVRRMHAALDEADRADKGADEREQEMFRLSLENQELREELEHRKALQEDASAAARNTIAENDAAYAKIQQLEQWLADARSKAADALWKIERPM